MAQRPIVPSPGDLTITQPCLLIVEGVADQEVWRALLRERADIQIEQTEGKDNLLLKLPTLVRAPGFRRVRWLGIIQDADEDPRAAFDRICGAIRRVSLEVPRRPWEATNSDPAVVAFVLPDGTSSGDLESFLWLGLTGQPAVPCVDDYITCLRASNLAPQRESKARMYAYLASLNRPDLRLSHAIRAGQVAIPGLQRFLDLLPPPISST